MFCYRLVVCLTYITYLSAIEDPENHNVNPTTDLVPLASSPECVEDVRNLHCGDPKASDIHTLMCLQADEKTSNAVSEKCQHLMWKTKLSLTRKYVFDKSVPKDCASEFDGITGCSQEENTVFYVPCLILHKEQVKNVKCMSHLNSLAAMVFEDYHLFSKFIGSCSRDIERYQCGRIESGPMSPADQLRHLAVKTQGKTLHCLQVRIESLEPPCRTQILRISELQSDDYHLDRPLFYACHGDRERFCSDVNAGEGRVYACLEHHKTRPEMSTVCRDAIVERQKLRAVDYRISFRFTEACKSDISRWSCTPSDSQPSSAALSRVMLCLEAVEKPDQLDHETGNQNDLSHRRHLKPECKAELTEMRRELLEDYRISPDVMAHCEHTIDQHCAAAKAEPGAVIHCLVNLMRHAGGSDQRPPVSCIDAVTALIKVTDVEANVRLDPVIESACHSMLTTKCAEEHETNGAVFDCLLSHEHDPEMPISCRKRVHEWYYFISRDITMDEQFLRSCAVDAYHHCGLPASSAQYWSGGQQNAGVASPSISHPHLLTCLYNHRMPQRLSNGAVLPGVGGDCRRHVHRLMLARASSVSLNPDVFEVCLADLAIHCESEEEEKDDENDFSLGSEGSGRDKSDRKVKATSGMACLQEFFHDLRPDCKHAVVEFTANSAEDPNLDKFVSMACLSAEDDFCSGYTDSRDIFQCLIKHKNDPKMPYNCLVAVEHLQRISLKDVKISRAFMLDCRKDAETFCKDSFDKGKAAVINCLSLRMSVHAVLGDIQQQQHAIGDSAPTKRYEGLSTGCTKQMSLELLQRSESIKLDPELDQVCHADAKRLCPHTKPGNGRVLKCLRKNRDELSATCHAKLFQRDEVLASNHQSDYPLMAACGRMIAVHCSTVAAAARKQGYALDDESGDVIECLVDVMHRPETRYHFDTACRHQLLDMLGLRSKDYRLDPELQRSCRPDINKYCRADVAQADNDQYEKDGGVLHCLKKHFVDSNPEASLTPKCYSRIRYIIALEHVFFKLDPVLIKACRTDIMQECHSHLSAAAKQVALKKKKTEHGENIDGHNDDDDNDDDDTDDFEDSIRDCLSNALQNNRLSSTACIKEVTLFVREEITDINLDPHLSQACSVELHKYCGKIVPGEGKLMACLLNELNRPDALTNLGKACHQQLVARRELWDYVSSHKAPDSMIGVVQQVNSSNLRNVFLLALFTIISLFFCVGICCGRVTKRVSIELKTR